MSSVTCRRMGCCCCCCCRWPSWSGLPHISLQSFLSQAGGGRRFSPPYSLPHTHTGKKVPGLLLQKVNFSNGPRPRRNGDLFPTFSSVLLCLLLFFAAHTDSSFPGGTAAKICLLHQPATSYEIARREKKYVIPVVATVGFSHLQGKNIPSSKKGSN